MWKQKVPPADLPAKKPCATEHHPTPQDLLCTKESHSIDSTKNFDCVKFVVENARNLSSSDSEMLSCVVDKLLQPVYNCLENQLLEKDHCKSMPGLTTGADMSTGTVSASCSASESLLCHDLSRGVDESFSGKRSLQDMGFTSDSSSPGKYAVRTIKMLQCNPKEDGVQEK